MGALRAGLGSTGPSRNTATMATRKDGSVNHAPTVPVIPGRAASPGRRLNKAVTPATAAAVSKAAVTVAARVLTPRPARMSSTGS